MISGCRCEVNENGALLGYCAVSSGNFLLNPDDGTNRLSQNVGKKLPLLPA